MFVKIDFEIKPEATLPPPPVAPALFTIINLQCAKPSPC